MTRLEDEDNNPRENSPVLHEALKRFLDIPYPKNCRGRNVYGIELIILDADIYSAVEKISDGNRDPQLLNLLNRLELDAKTVLPALEAGAHYYYEQARALARLALDSVPVEGASEMRLVGAVVAADVEGSLPRGYAGGVATAEISKRDGRILSVIHTK